VLWTIWLAGRGDQLIIWILVSGPLVT